MASVIEKGWLGAADRAGTASGEIGLISVSAGGSNRSHETAESEALSRVLGRSEATRIFAPRSLVGEGEAWTSALQVALAAHSVFSGRSMTSQNIAPDASPVLHERAGDGELPYRTAIVSGIGPGQNYSAIHLSGLDA